MKNDRVTLLEKNYFELYHKGDYEISGIYYYWNENEN